MMPRPSNAVTPHPAKKKRRPRINPRTLQRVRLAVYQRDSFRCRTCGWAPRIPDGYDGRYALAGNAEPCGPKRRTWRILELDHIHPYLLGGKFTVDNLQALCNVCNVRKGAQV